MGFSRKDDHQCLPFLIVIYWLLKKCLAINLFLVDDDLMQQPLRHLPSHYVDSPPHLWLVKASLHAVFFQVLDHLIIEKYL